MGAVGFCVLFSLSSRGEVGSFFFCPDPLLFVSSEGAVPVYCLYMVGQSPLSFGDLNEVLAVFLSKEQKVSRVN